MSQFIRIGNRVINTELVTDIAVNEEGSISVYFAAPAGDHARVRTFEGADVAALQKWIEKHAREWTGEGEKPAESFSFSYDSRLRG
jgi:hypothetical protein